MPWTARSSSLKLAWAADHKALLVPAHFGGSGAVEVRRDGDRFALQRWAEFST
jgi:hypothetical protein